MVQLRFQVQRQRLLWQRAVTQRDPREPTDSRKVHRQLAGRTQTDRHLRG